MSVYDIIKGSPLFVELYDEEVETIVNQCSVISLKENDFIVREGEHGNEIFLILTGKALVKKGSTVLAELKKGDLFGELVLINETLRTADVVSETFTDVLVMSYENIFGLFHTNPRIFSLLILNLSRLLTKRLKDAGQTIRELNSKLNKYKVRKRPIKRSVLRDYFYEL